MIVKKELMILTESQPYGNSSSTAHFCCKFRTRINPFYLSKTLLRTVPLLARKLFFFLRTQINLPINLRLCTFLLQGRIDEGVCQARAILEQLEKIIAGQFQRLSHVYANKPVYFRQQIV
jgi:hypothetical protein